MSRRQWQALSPSLVEREEKDLSYVGVLTCYSSLLRSLGGLVIFEVKERVVGSRG